MKRYQITAEVKFKLHWLQPASSPAERIFRGQAQIRLHEKAFALSKALETILEITTIDGEDS